MYIPQIHVQSLDPPEGVLGAGQGSLVTYHRRHSEPPDSPGPSLICQFFAPALSAAAAAAAAPDDHGPGLRARDAASQVNTTIGVTVAILLVVFLVAFFWFLHVYRHSIRFTFRKKRRHHKSVASANPDGGAGGQGEVPAG